MTQVTLLEKAYRPFSPKIFEPFLKSLCQDLQVQLKIVGDNNQWVQVEVSGEDEAVALRFLDQQIGLAPESMEKIEKFSVFSGRIAKQKSKTELYVDIGVFAPETLYAIIPLQRLQAQLADGKKFALQRIMELYGLDNNVPVNVKVVDVDKEERQVLAEFSHSQIARFEDWIKASVDRLFVLGSLRSYVERAVKVSGHGRDVIKIEPFGLLDHVIVCKLGTEAKGLVPRLGKHLRTASLVVFSPRKIREFIDKT